MTPVQRTRYAEHLEQLSRKWCIILCGCVSLYMVGQSFRNDFNPSPREAHASLTNGAPEISRGDAEPPRSTPLDGASL